MNSKTYGLSIVKNCKNLPQLFQIPLEYATYLSMYDDGVMVPRLIRDCICHIEYNGLDEEGLYRKSGLTTKIDTIIKLYNSYHDVDIRHYDIHTVASVLKLYLRDLPDNIITNEVKPQLEEYILEITSNKLEPTEYLTKLKDIIIKLPRCHYDTLGWLCVHFKRVADKPLNLMDINNLAIVLVPTLRFSKIILSILVEYSPYLFPAVKLNRPQCRYLSPYKLINEIDKHETDLIKINKKIENNKANEKYYTKSYYISKELENLKKRMNGIIDHQQKFKIERDLNRQNNNNTHTTMIEDSTFENRTFSTPSNPGDVYKMICNLKKDLGLDCRKILQYNKSLSMGSKEPTIDELADLEDNNIIDNTHVSKKKLTMYDKSTSMAEMDNNNINILSSSRRQRKEQHKITDGTITDRRNKYLGGFSFDENFNTSISIDENAPDTIENKDYTVDIKKNLHSCLTDSIDDINISSLNSVMSKSNSHDLNNFTQFSTLNTNDIQNCPMIDEKVKQSIIDDFTMYKNLIKETSKLFCNIKKLNEFLTLETEYFQELKEKIENRLMLTDVVFKYFIENGVNINNQEHMLSLQDKDQQNTYFSEINDKNKTLQDECAEYSKKYIQCLNELIENNIKINDFLSEKHYSNI